MQSRPLLGVLCFTELGFRVVQIPHTSSHVPLSLQLAAHHEVHQ